MTNRSFSDLSVSQRRERIAGHEAVIEGIFDELRRVRDSVLAMAG